MKSLAFSSNVLKGMTFMPFFQNLYSASSTTLLGLTGWVCSLVRHSGGLLIRRSRVQIPSGPFFCFIFFMFLILNLLPCYGGGVAVFFRGFSRIFVSFLLYSRFFSVVFATFIIMHYHRQLALIHRHDLPGHWFRMFSLLYVDDEPGLLEIGQVFLEKTGDFSVTTALSGRTGLEAVSHSMTFDAIVSDYQMPEMDGIEFLRNVRKSFGNIPFILFTGRGSEEVIIEAVNNGVDFYIQKSGDPGAQFMELAHRVRQAVSAPGSGCT